MTKDNTSFMEGCGIRNSLDYFILVAKEKSVTRAASKAYISQQAMSKYLKNLESRCGTKLCNRSPEFSLTPAGETMLYRAQQIQQLVNSLNSELSSVINNNVGHVRIGISLGRSVGTLPPVLGEFWRRYPNVSVEAVTTVTSEMFEKLLQGKLDLVVGMDVGIMPQVEQTILSKESIYLAISDNMLKQYFPNDYPNCKAQFQNDIDLHRFTHVPFANNLQTTQINTLVNNYLRDNNVKLNFRLSTYSNELNLLMCDSTASFCMGFMLPYVYEYNALWGTQNHVNIFSIPAFKDCISLSAYQLSSSDQSPYIDYLIELLISHFTKRANLTPPLRTKEDN